MTLDYHGQIIDLSGAYQTKIFNAEAKQWQGLSEDLSKASLIDLFGVKLPVIPLNVLRTYKMALSRDVDIQDIQEINKVLTIDKHLTDY